jgi:hypothetical protein
LVTFVVLWAGDMWTTWRSTPASAQRAEAAREDARERVVLDSVLNARRAEDSAAVARQRRPSDAELRERASVLASLAVPSEPPAVATPADTQVKGVEAVAPEVVDVVRGARWVGRVRPVGTVPGGVPNGLQVVAPDSEVRRMVLPTGALLLLQPRSRFTFSVDSSALMRGMLSGEMVLVVPEWSRWEIQTLSGTFTLGPGRYAVRNWERGAGAQISIDSGAVYIAAGDSVVGRGVFALVTREPLTVQKVDGHGFPVLPSPPESRQ